MNATVVKMLGVLALSVALVFLEGLLPERHRVKTRDSKMLNYRVEARR